MAAPRRYELRLLDRTLVEFDVADGPFGVEVPLVDFDETARGLMPCGLDLTPDGIWTWLEVRSIPTNRRNAGLICRELGFDLGDTEALYRASLGLSLNDSYWVVPRGFAGAFDDYDLYDNDFSEAIGALSVSGTVTLGGLHGNTPELTTDGTLRKGWRIVEGRRMLYKGASDGIVPGEPTSEYLVSLIARDLGIDAVLYGIDVWNDERCSTCEDFATKELSYVPFAVATGMTDLAGVIWWCASLGMDVLESLCDMLALDALVCNTDRHLTNFGVLRDAETGRPCGLAPAFDNGRALFPDVADDDARQFALEAELRGPAFGGGTFGELLSRVMGERQRDLLERFASRGIVGNVEIPARRVAVLDAFLRARACELAKIPVIDHSELANQDARAMRLRSARTNGTHRLDPSIRIATPLAT